MDNIYSKKSICCGCTACYSVCPTGAISMQSDEKGFTYPVIDKNKCINCKKCQRVCPSGQEISQIAKQKVYAVKNKNEKKRLSSSSGGFFGELATEIINKNGIVYGASYNEENEVIHIAIDNINDIYKLKGSKYVQSYTKGIYKSVEKNLKEKKLVLFSGTPCQVYGLKSFLNKDYDNLITCDTICHGVPSPKIFNEHKLYLEKKYKSKIKSINFRYKNENNIQNLYILFENNKEYIKIPNKDDYYFLFSKNFILRESCFECHFSNMNRIADITMGDFWGIEKSFPNYDDKKGISLVIINTEKGELYFDKIKKTLDYLESNTKDCLQPNLISPSKKPSGYIKFWSTYKKKGYIKAKNKIKKIYFINRVKNKIIEKRRRKNVER